MYKQLIISTDARIYTGSIIICTELMMYTELIKGRNGNTREGVSWGRGGVGSDGRNDGKEK